MILNIQAFEDLLANKLIISINQNLNFIFVAEHEGSVNDIVSSKLSLFISDVIYFDLLLIEVFHEFDCFLKIPIVRVVVYKNQMEIGVVLLQN